MIHAVLQTAAASIRKSNSSLSLATTPILNNRTPVPLTLRTRARRRSALIQSEELFASLEELEVAPEGKTLCRPGEQRLDGI
jgi:hypothetical protein